MFPPNCDIFFFFPNFLRCKNIISLKLFFYFHFASLIMIKLLEIALFRLNIEKHIKKSPTSYNWNLSNSICDLKETCKIVPTENCQFWNFLATHSVYVSIKSLTKASKLLKMLRYWSLKETGTSYEQRFGFTKN